MPEPYSPIVRTFGQVRSVLLSQTDLARQDVRPGTALETILPSSIRPEVWRELRACGLRVPDLELSKRDRERTFWSGLLLTVSLAVFVCSENWSRLPITVSLALAVCRAARRRAVEFPIGLKTLGELVICSTCFSDHKGSGYRWTRNEMSLKVRLIVAISQGLPLDVVQPERTWAELGMD